LWDENDKSHSYAAKGHFLELLQNTRSAEGLKSVVYPSVAVAIKEITKSSSKTE